MAVNGFGEEHAYIAEALPSPSNTPYRTPSAGSRNRSQRSSFYDGSSIGLSSSPPLPPDKSWHHSNSNNDEGKISALDPRRFTPTLHANLVSEILSLRRDLESRTGSMEGLEAALHTSRTEFDAMKTTFAASAKETRSLRRQLQLLEGGTESALSELARERDEAVESVSETKRRLEASQRKLRSQEEDAVRAHDRSEQDRQAWLDERRHLERKIHVVEGRLKAIIEEVALQQAVAQVNGHPGADSEAEEASKDSGLGHGSDSGSIRSIKVRTHRVTSSMSVDEKRNVRLSTLSGLDGFTGSKFTGLSLADELGMDEELEDEIEADEEQERAHLRQSITGASIRGSIGRQTDEMDGHIETHGRGTVQPVDVGSKHQSDSTIVNSIAPSAAIVGKDKTSERKFEYVDTGVQFSAPPSPKVSRTLSPELVDRAIDVDRSEDRDMSPTSIEANQRRKRTSAGSLLGHGQLPAIVVPPSPVISTSCQTAEAPLSPPRTPKSPDREAPLPPTMQLSAYEASTTGTQTDPPTVSAPVRPALLAPTPVPSIAIYPPSSSPPMSGRSLLPPHTKSVGCQASLPPKTPVKIRSTSMQTEEIRIDRRLIKLPPNLLPSAISSKPPSPEPIPSRAILGKAPTLPSRKVGKRFSKERNCTAPPSSPPAAQIGSKYANDEGPLRSGKTNKIRRPIRKSSLFAGFEQPSSDDADDFAEAELSDNDFRTALSAPKPGTGFPRPPSTTGDTISRWSADSQSQVATDRSSQAITDRSSQLVSSQRSSSNVSGSAILNYAGAPPNSLPSIGRRPSRDRPIHRFRHENNPLASNPVRPLNIRKSAMISSGAAAHTQQRTRSPTSRRIREEAGEGVKTEPIPPFPVPTRSSSRRLPLSASDGGRSPTRPGNSSLNGQGGSGLGGPRRDNLRKVRSAATMPRHSRQDRQRSDSPPGSSQFDELPESPAPQAALPPLPMNGAAIAQRYQQGHHPSIEASSPRSRSTSATGAASVCSPVPQINVVDAISQTMIGEWMWKYVRKRKSFGVAETADGLPTTRIGEDGMVNITGNGTRHKRWVWLAPYDRAVVWSSRQPMSGTALLGKNGRKLTIQSVLDVRDDTPMPRSAQPSPSTAFNRSIIVLTPTRALKFTAASRERHYVWLTALSFLSAAPATASPLGGVPTTIDEHSTTRTIRRPKLESAMLQRRNQPIRDGIRVAKGKNRPLLDYESSATSPLPPPSPTSGRALHIPQLQLQHSTASIDLHRRDPSYPDPARAAAEPPVVPRFLTGGRRRSNTGPRVPTSAFLTLTSGSHQPVPSAGGMNSAVTMTSASGGSYGGGTLPSPTLTVNGGPVGGGFGSACESSVTSGLHAYGGSTSGAASNFSAMSGTAMTHGNFFESVGTVRMEAFVRTTPPPPSPAPVDTRRQQVPVAHLREQSHSRMSSRSTADGRIRDGKGHPAARMRQVQLMPLADAHGNRVGSDRPAFRGEDPFRGF